MHLELCFQQNTDVSGMLTIYSTRIRLLMEWLDEMLLVRVAVIVKSRARVLSI